MKKRYEDACNHEGLSNEEMGEIRRLYDADYKKLKREKEYREKNEILFNSLSSLGINSDGQKEYDIPDFTNEPLGLILKEEEHAGNERMLAVLRECLDEMDPDEADILIRYYAGTYGIGTQMASELGMDRKAFMRKTEKLLEKIRKSFNEKLDE